MLHYKRYVLPVVLVLILLCRVAWAGGLIPDRGNRVVISGEVDVGQPGFLLIFSARPLADQHGRMRTTLTSRDIQDLQGSPDYAVVSVYGKASSRRGQFEYSFGPAPDGDCPWNSGKEMAWQNWAKYSPDVWDNLAITCLPGPDQSPAKPYVIRDVKIVRGDQLLYDSSARHSYPNKRDVDASFQPTKLGWDGTQFTLLNLAESMRRFRNDHYELDDNPILVLAYSDLGQTEKSKYAVRGKAWCSEFASWVYRQNRIPTPDPNATDVHFANMRTACEKIGQVYPARLVASWPAEKKRKLILPGSFVSLVLGDSTHSVMFTTWIGNPDENGAKFAAISGNNKGMVWSHAPMAVQAGESADPARAADFDKKAYFAVPQVLEVYAAKRAQGKERRQEPEIRETPKAESKQPAERKPPPPRMENPLRTWTDSTGNHSIEARFGGFAGGEVTLIRADGTRVKLPLDRLSEADRKWIRDRGR